MTGVRINAEGDDSRRPASVEVETNDDDFVELTVGDGTSQVTIAGSRIDVTRVVIEADKLLGRLPSARRQGL